MTPEEMLFETIQENYKYRWMLARVEDKLGKDFILKLEKEFEEGLDEKE